MTITNEIWMLIGHCPYKSPWYKANLQLSFPQIWLIWLLLCSWVSHEYGWCGFSAHWLKLSSDYWGTLSGDLIFSPSLSHITQYLVLGVHLLCSGTMCFYSYFEMYEWQQGQGRVMGSCLSLVSFAHLCGIWMAAGMRSEQQMPPAFLCPGSTAWTACFVLNSSGTWSPFRFHSHISLWEPDTWPDLTRIHLYGCQLQKALNTFQGKVHGGNKEIISNSFLEHGNKGIFQERKIIFYCCTCNVHSC